MVIYRPFLGHFWTILWSFKAISCSLKISIIVILVTSSWYWCSLPSTLVDLAGCTQASITALGGLFCFPEEDVELEEDEWDVLGGFVTWPW